MRLLTYQSSYLLRPSEPAKAFKSCENIPVSLFPTRQLTLLLTITSSNRSNCSELLLSGLIICYAPQTLNNHPLQPPAGDKAWRLWSLTGDPAENPEHSVYSIKLSWHRTTALLKAAQLLLLRKKATYTKRQFQEILSSLPSALAQKASV